MIVVIDTNIFVSALLTPFGNPAEILRLVVQSKLKPAYDTRIITEYREVLLRNKFPFTENQVNSILDLIMQDGLLVTPLPLRKNLPDPDDEIFLQAAISATAEALITGNKNHFPKSSCEGIKVTSPIEFLEFYKKN